MNNGFGNFNFPILIRNNSIIKHNPILVWVGEGHAATQFSVKEEI